MKLKLAALIFSLGISSMGIAAEANYPKTFIMPSEETLLKRLQEKEFGVFAEKTDIAKKLGNQEKFSLGVANQIELSLVDYEKELEQSMPKQLAAMVFAHTYKHKKQLLKLLLQEHPEALEELKGYELYEA